GGVGEHPARAGAAAGAAFSYFSCRPESWSSCAGWSCLPEAVFSEEAADGVGPKRRGRRALAAGGGVLPGDAETESGGARVLGEAGARVERDARAFQVGVRESDVVLPAAGQAGEGGRRASGPPSSAGRAQPQ